MGQAGLGCVWAAEGVENTIRADMHAWVEVVTITMFYVFVTN